MLGTVYTYTLLKEVEDSPNEFYELEPLEVVAVHLDDTKKYFPQKKDGGPDYSFLGGVKGRFVNSELGKNIDSLSDYKPLNPNFQITPVVGEIVCTTVSELLNVRLFPPNSTSRAAASV